MVQRGSKPRNGGNPITHGCLVLGKQSCRPRRTCRIGDGNYVRQGARSEPFSSLGCCSCSHTGSSVARQTVFRGLSCNLIQIRAVKENTILKPAGQRFPPARAPAGRPARAPSLRLRTSPCRSGETGEQVLGPDLQGRPGAGVPCNDLRGHSTNQGKGLAPACPAERGVTEMVMCSRAGGLRVDRGVQEAREAFQDMAGEVIFHQGLSVVSCSSRGCCGAAWVSGRGGSVWVQPSEELAVETLIQPSVAGHVSKCSAIEFILGLSSKF